MVTPFIKKVSLYIVPKIHLHSNYKNYDIMERLSQHIVSKMKKKKNHNKCIVLYASRHFAYENIISMSQRVLLHDVSFGFAQNSWNIF